MAISIITATRNRAKSARLRNLCAGLGLDIVDAGRLDSEPQVEEDASSHLGNAVRKAVGWSTVHQALVIASDGGLAIPSLGPAWSSLITRRGTGGDVPDDEHARRLLQRMRDKYGPEREAHWTEAVAVARCGVLVEAWEASGLHGEVAEDFVPPTGGTEGFWVSGLWQDGAGRRLWALGPAELEKAGDPWTMLRPHVRGLLGRFTGTLE